MIFKLSNHNLDWEAKGRSKCNNNIYLCCNPQKIVDIISYLISIKIAFKNNSYIFIKFPQWTSVAHRQHPATHKLGHQGLWNVVQFKVEPRLSHVRLQETFSPIQLNYGMIGLRTLAKDNTNSHLAILQAGIDSTSINFEWKCCWCK